MQDFTPEQIKERFDQLQPEMQELLSSPEIHEKIKKVGDKHNLMIDQIGYLVDQVGLVMLGLAKSSDFVKDISSRLSISNEDAQKVAADMNSEIFINIKNTLQGNTSTRERFSEKNTNYDHSSIEKAGEFKIEHDNYGDNNKTGNETGINNNVGFSVDEHDELINHIENPIPSRQNIGQEKAGLSYDSGNYMKEPLVGQLLHGSSSTPEEKVNVTPTTPVTPPPQKPNNPANPLMNDPYREPMK